MGPGRTSRAWYFHTSDCAAVKSEIVMNIIITPQIISLYDNIKKSISGLTA